MRRAAWLVAAWGVGAGAALAAGPQARPPGPGGPDPARIQAELGVSEPQMARLRELQTSHRKREIQARADREIARIELEELLRAEPVDAAAVRAKGQQIANLEAAAAKERVELLLGVRGILSADQAERLRRLMREADGPVPGQRPARGPAARRGAFGDDSPGGPEREAVGDSGAPPL